MNRAGNLHAQEVYQHFEARHVHPIGLTPDGSKLLALNSTDARLSVFDVSNPANPSPVLIAEIPVGLEPVSLRARTNDEVWVVSELSDCVSVVSLSQGLVIATLRTPDEPADVVFANGKAFVSCARNNTIRIFDAVNRTQLGAITLTGDYPRALAASADGSRVYAAFLMSGNRTTVLPASVAPAPPSPTNPALPAPPQTALIVPANDPRVPYSVLDNDVVEINTTTNSVVRYISDVGTNLFDLTLHPTTGELWVANTDALNLVRFEPALRGHFLDHRLTKVALPGTAVTTYDLNPGINYSLLPNPTAQATALSQPTAAIFAADGSHGWLAAFNSDRVARFSSAGEVQARVDLRNSEDGTRQMRGPRGLTLSADATRLYVLNKLSNSISIVDAPAATVLAEIPTGSRDPMPTALKEGRGYLFDARLSGNGTSSCASCHIDADRDGLAWDLGDPGGDMITVIGYNNSVHEATPRNRAMHPMKGPMTTQTMKGFQAGQIFHWRGDRPSIEAFNPTFSGLMGGSPITSIDMSALTAYLNSIKLHPNPYRALNRALPSTFAGGNPTNGHAMYNDHAKSHCATCHTLPTGSDNNVDLDHIVGSTQFVKTPHLRTVYQRSNFNKAPGTVNVSGYGLLKDGTGDELAIAHFYDLSNLSTMQELLDMNAYVQCFDTGTAPAVGYCITVTTANRATTTVLNDLTTLQGQAVANCNLVVRGIVAGRQRQYLYVSASQNYSSDDSSLPSLTQAALLASLTPGDALTFMGVPVGSGPRHSRDRNANGLANAQEPTPYPKLAPFPNGAAHVQWPAANSDWVLEWSPNMLPPWQTVTDPRTNGSSFIELHNDYGQSERRFYRLRRVW